MQATFSGERFSREPVHPHTRLIINDLILSYGILSALLEAVTDTQAFQTMIASIQWPVLAFLMKVKRPLLT